MWQPIETCPKDGTRFLAFKPSLFGATIVVCEWLDEDHPDYDGETPHVAWDFSGFWDATHWMPLPDPPSSNKEVRGKLAKQLNPEERP